MLKRKAEAGGDHLHDLPTKRSQPLSNDLDVAGKIKLFLPPEHNYPINLWKTYKLSLPVRLWILYLRHWGKTQNATSNVLVNLMKQKVETFLLAYFQL